MRLGLLRIDFQRSRRSNEQNERLAPVFPSRFSLKHVDVRMQFHQSIYVEQSILLSGSYGDDVAFLKQSNEQILIGNEKRIFLKCEESQLSFVKIFPSSSDDVSGNRQLCLYL